MSVVTAHMVYFCACARSEIFPKNTRELGVGLGQFLSGVNGLKNNTPTEQNETKLEATSTHCGPIFVIDHVIAEESDTVWEKYFTWEFIRLRV